MPIDDPNRYSISDILELIPVRFPMLRDNRVINLWEQYSESHFQISVDFLDTQSLLVLNTDFSADLTSYEPILPNFRNTEH